MLLWKMQGRSPTGRCLSGSPSRLYPGPADASQEWALDPKLAGTSTAVAFGSLSYKETLCFKSRLTESNKVLFLGF